MKKLYWSITNKCNLTCRYCYYNSGLEDKVEYAVEKHDNLKIIDDVAVNFNEVVFTGGEALLHPQIFELIKKLKEKKVVVSILSNAVILNETMVNKLISLQVDDVAISLDSLDEETNDYLRGKSELVMQGVNNLIMHRGANMGLEIMMTVTRKNISSIKPMVDFCGKNKINLWLDPVEIDCQSTNLQNLKLEKMSDKEKEELKDAMRYWQQKSQNPHLSQYVNNCLDIIDGKKPSKISCPMGTESFVLDPDGNLFPCFLRKDLCMGNLFDKKVKAIFDEGKISKYVNVLKSGTCVRLGCVCMTIASDYKPY